ncbi:TetR family transcriptional regulator [Paenibacillus sp. FSL R7-0273]|uniref:TetR/AcrR family transcriptional regulator n=1 Tax=Paenibacillus sp. FSL R7-0273 TaxID=1536772 RepID=UPI0004F77915|nr:TetR/AcrR family transcriptional regulator [Paenibacillus sp. FSL R7-0273]AIQ48569.1 TetR family transcriptional regulator [Paenibacillus sp. FSL R7-0273]OMF87576.1 TetR family transcriptional regulator [Paenibacillus sp. FSL R7-0273]
MNPKLTLRDQKKEATAYALSVAAFELALVHGMDGFIVDDVVRQAGVSRRTFANYFSCKEEAVAEYFMTRATSEDENDLLAHLAPDATPLDALYSLLKLQFTSEFLRRLRQFASLANQYPSLEPYILSVFRRLQMAAQEVLERFTHGRYSDGYTHLLAGAVYGAFVPILDGRLNVLLPGESQEDRPGSVSFDQYLNSMFDYLRNGF